MQLQISELKQNYCQELDLGFKLSRLNSSICSQLSNTCALGVIELSKSTETSQSDILPCVLILKIINILENTKIGKCI